MGVYAKAHDRLRVEVRHRTNPRRTYGARATNEEYPNRTPEQLVSFLEFVGQQAHERASVFFDALRGRVRAAPPTITRLVDLLDNISQACRGDRDLTHRMLALLVAGGRIVRTEDPQLRGAVDALVRSGVLTRTRSTRRSTPGIYMMAPSYSGTLRALQDLVAREADQGTS